jgi:hypothetical protein
LARVRVTAEFSHRNHGKNYTVGVI